MNLSLKVLTIVFIGILLTALVTSFSYHFVNDFESSIVKLIIILIILLVITIIVGTAIIHFTVTPIKYLNQVTKTIASGNLGGQIELQSNDEIGELSNNLNLVIKNLVASLQSMANSLSSERIEEAALAVSLKKIRLQEAKDLALLSNIGDGVIAVDNNKQITLFNKAASELLGYTSEEVMGHPYNHFLKFLYEEENTPAKDFIAITLSGVDIEQREQIVAIRKDNSEVPVAHTTRTIINSDNKIIGVVVILRDITREKQLNKLKDEFVSLASHELRTPMTAIKGFISMIQEGDFGPVSQEIREPIDDIGTSADRLIHLVSDMLNVSRIEAGRIKIILTDQQIKPIIDETVSLLQPIAQQKNIKLESTNIAEVSVQFDIDKVKQVLDNLIGNALKFTDKGNITVSTKFAEEQLHVFVTDTGMGINSENQKKLFGKFEQISSQQEGKPVGTGLGLYLSRELIRKMGGQMWIEKSAIGKGSTFGFSLPFTKTKLAKQVKEAIDKEAQIHPD